MRQKNEFEIQKKNLELNSLDIESLCNQNFSMQMYPLKVIKKRREEDVMDKILQKLLSSNDELYAEYNSEEN